MVPPIFFSSNASTDLEKSTFHSKNVPQKLSIVYVIFARLFQLICSIVGVGLILFLRFPDGRFYFSSSADDYWRSSYSQDIFILIIHGFVIVFLLFQLGSYIYRGNNKNAVVQTESWTVAKAITFLLALLLMIGAILALIGTASGQDGNVWRHSGTIPVWGVKMALGWMMLIEGLLFFGSVYLGKTMQLLSQKTTDAIEICDQKTATAKSHGTVTVRVA